MGRPTIYNPEYDKQAFQLCLLGATDKEMADIFKISEKTLNNWKQQHDSFVQSLAEGKAAADAKVAHSLYLRALDGDTKACIYWLNNRRSGNWRNHMSQEVTGKDGGPLKVESMSDDELDAKIAKILPSFM